MSDNVRNMIIERIAQFARNLFDSSDDEQALRSEMDRFLEFFCVALEAARSDGRRSASDISLN